MLLLRLCRSVFSVSTAYFCVSPSQQSVIETGSADTPEILASIIANSHREISFVIKTIHEFSRQKRGVNYEK